MVVFFSKIVLSGRKVLFSVFVFLPLLMTNPSSTSVVVEGKSSATVEQGDNQRFYQGAGKIRGRSTMRSHDDHANPKSTDAAAASSENPDVILFCADIVHSFGASIAAFIALLTFVTKWKKTVTCFSSKNNCHTVIKINTPVSLETDWGLWGVHSGAGLSELSLAEKEKLPAKRFRDVFDLQKIERELDVKIAEFDQEVVQIKHVRGSTASSSFSGHPRQQGGATVAKEIAIPCSNKLEAEVTVQVDKTKFIWAEDGQRKGVADFLLNPFWNTLPKLLQPTCRPDDLLHRQRPEELAPELLKFLSNAATMYWAWKRERDVKTATLLRLAVDRQEGEISRKSSSSAAAGGGASISTPASVVAQQQEETEFDLALEQLRAMEQMQSPDGHGGGTSTSSVDNVINAGSSSSARPSSLPPTPMSVQSLRIQLAESISKLKDEKQAWIESTRVQHTFSSGVLRLYFQDYYSFTHSTLAANMLLHLSPAIFTEEAFQVGRALAFRPQTWPLEEELVDVASRYFNSTVYFRNLQRKHARDWKPIFSPSSEDGNEHSTTENADLGAGADSDNPALETPAAAAEAGTSAERDEESAHAHDGAATRITSTTPSDKVVKIRGSEADLARLQEKSRLSGRERRSVENSMISSTSSRGGGGGSAGGSSSSSTTASRKTVPHVSAPVGYNVNGGAGQNFLPKATRKLIAPDEDDSSNEGGVLPGGAAGTKSSSSSCAYVLLRRRLFLPQDPLVTKVPNFVGRTRRGSRQLTHAEMATMIADLEVEPLSTNGNAPAGNAQAPASAAAVITAAPDVVSSAAPTATYKSTTDPYVSMTSCARQGRATNFYANQECVQYVSLRNFVRKIATIVTAETNNEVNCAALNLNLYRKSAFSDLNVYTEDELLHWEKWMSDQISPALFKFYILRKPYHLGPRYDASINLALFHLASEARVFISEVGTFWGDALLLSRLANAAAPARPTDESRAKEKIGIVLEANGTDVRVVLSTRLIGEQNTTCGLVRGRCTMVDRIWNGFYH
ncbi:unnamed protein product [Amoebophrya sp. A120]|nr:unnamed protein product [Amoebophrya sp. A120]|eukprot:GSA120T00010765001.1